jgi:hypothetical protein
LNPHREYTPQGYFSLYEMGNDLSSHVVTFVNPKLYVITITPSFKVSLSTLGVVLTGTYMGIHFITRTFRKFATTILFLTLQI